MKFIFSKAGAGMTSSPVRTQATFHPVHALHDLFHGAGVGNSNVPFLEEAYSGHEPDASLFYHSLAKIDRPADLPFPYTYGSPSR